MNSATDLNVLVIGGVATGPKAASRLKRLKPGARVTMIERDTLVSYGACGLPYFVEGLFSEVEELIRTPADVPRNVAFFEKAKGVAVRTGVEALRIDRDRKTVTVQDLSSRETEDLPYDKLVLATGGYPFRPPIPGVELKNVWFMTHPDHAESLVAQIEAQNLKKIVLVGAGFIGIEMAEALKLRGLDVVVVEMADQIMTGILDEDMARFGARALTGGGVELVLGEQVTALEGEETVTGVKTNVRSIGAEAVIIAVGTRPNDALAREAGLDCMERGGILINEYCQTSDPDIYAGGDCVVNRYYGGGAGGSWFVALGSTANKHGRIIADHIAGKPVPFPGIGGTGVVRAFNFNLGRTGMGERQAKNLNLDVETVVWAGPDRPHYMPDARPLLIKMIAGRRDRKLIGVQVAGPGDGAKRLDVAAALILMGATLDDVAGVDFAYAPPFSPPIDPLAACAHLLTNKLDGLAVSVSPEEALRRISGSHPPLVIDTRTPREIEEMPFPEETLAIPLGALRERLAELPKDREILTFCKVSLRGYEAQRILNAAGFDRVAFIEGGVFGWSV